MILAAAILVAVAVVIGKLFEASSRVQAAERIATAIESHKGVIVNVKTDAPMEEELPPPNQYIN